MASYPDPKLIDNAAAKSVEHEIVACVRPDIAGTFSINANLADAVSKHATEEEKQRIIDELLPRANPALGDPRGDHHRQFLRTLGATNFD